MKIVPRISVLEMLFSNIEKKIMIILILISFKKSYVSICEYIFIQSITVKHNVLLYIYTSIYIHLDTESEEEADSEQGL